MRKILAGVETEYGLHIRGRGADSQVEDAKEFVKSYPGVHLAAWDYRYESPRSDLRGFKVDRLSFDPEDAKFDIGKSHGPAHEVRADRVLANGARLYNDHGHPEYSTPETWSLEQLSLHDRAGQLAALQCAKVLQEQIGEAVSVYKNNSDFHGASYGTHEGYLVPRSLPFETLQKAVLPMLVARQVLTGAGKVGSETKEPISYQISQRADFFVETTNLETLFKRPIFNTRDEPHSDPAKWIRLHVISGDSNMIRSATARKVGLVKLAVALAEIDQAPIWSIKDPVRTFQSISRDQDQKFIVELNSGSWTTALEILESYYSTAERFLELDKEMRELISSSRKLAQDLQGDPAAFRSEVDWAAKKFILEQVIEEEGREWNDPDLRSYDLAYHNIDPEEGLFTALQEMGVVPTDPDDETLQALLDSTTEPTRARIRALAVQKFKDQIQTVSWTSIVFKGEDEVLELILPPDLECPSELEHCDNVGTFIDMVRGAA